MSTRNELLLAILGVAMVVAAVLITHRPFIGQFLYYFAGAIFGYLLRVRVERAAQERREIEAVIRRAEDLKERPNA